METPIPQRLAILGHEKRLAVFRLLMRRYPDRVAAGDLAEALGLKASTLSAYLASLMQAGLVVQERAGTSLRYAPDMDRVRETLDYLLLDCCRGRPDLCAPASLAAMAPEPRPERSYSVLFVCTGNSARSIFAEALLRDLGRGRFIAYSAGTEPRRAPNPAALEILRRNGHPTDSLRSKPVSVFRGPDAPQLDFVITVCDLAANEPCPPWEGRPLAAHWGIPAPGGSGPDRLLGLRRAYAMLRNRILAFTALPVDTLDRLALQRALDEIALDRQDARA